MAEFCYECYKKYFDGDAKKDKLIISKDNDLDLCEGCCEYKPIVIRIRKNSILDIFFAL